MKKITAISILLAALLPLGCKTTPTAKEGAKQGETAPLHAAGENTDNAIRKADDKTDTAAKANEERDSKVKANAEHAKETAETLPDSTQKTIIIGDLGVVLSLLDDVKVDPLEKVARARDALLVESGKVAEANASYAKAADQGRKDAARITQLEAEAAQAIKERDSARQSEKATLAKVDQRLEQNRLETEARIKKVYDEAQAKLYAKITWGLIIGTVLLAGLGASLAYGKFQAGEPVKAAIAAAFWGGAAAFCAIMSWLINQPWFQDLIFWTVIGGVSIGIIAGVIYVVAEVKSSKERRALDRDATEAESTLLHIYDVLDKDVPADSPLFDKLSKVLDNSQKALINELKALRQRAKAAGAVTP